MKEKKLLREESGKRQRNGRVHGSKYVNFYSTLKFLYAMYNLEIGRVISQIKKEKVKRVLLQLPDGLKPKANYIQNEIIKNTNTDVFIWAGSCFGACDIPLDHAKHLNVDLLIQWGHSKWK